MKARKFSSRSRAWRVCLAVLLALALGCQEKEISPQGYFEDSKDPEAVRYYNRGVAYYESGRYGGAIEAYKQAIRIKPDFSEAHNNLGASYLELGRYDEAIEPLERAIRLKPDNASACYALGASYGELGRHNEAVKALKKALRLKPDYADAYYNLGNSYFKLGLHNEAVEAYKHAIRIKPDYAEAYYNLGACYGQLSRYDEATEAYKQVLRLKPNSTEAHYNLGGTYSSMGDRQSALAEYEILKALDKEQADKLLQLITQPTDEVSYALKFDQELHIGVYGDECGEDAKIIVGTTNRFGVGGLNADLPARLLVYKGNNLVNEIRVSVTVSADGCIITYKGKTDSGKQFELKKRLRPSDMETELLSFAADFDPLRKLEGN
jgi:tetratricopeptide (TPR) repeat protein